jgi:DNA-binding LacI/PurR family transcriptional regulator
MLPGRKRLSAEYDVHVQTVERAVKALVDDGILEIEGTRGTFVSSAKRGAPIDLPASPTRSAAPQIELPCEASERCRTGATVGIVTTDYQISLQSGVILLNIEKSFSAAGGSTVFCDRIVKGDTMMSLHDAILQLFEQGVDVVVAIVISTPFPRDLVMLMHEGLPIVCVTSSPLQQPGWNVYYDSFDAAYQATRHLLNRGCKDFLFLAHEPEPWANDRLEGMRAALEHARLDADRLRVRFAASAVGDTAGSLARCVEIAAEELSAGMPLGIVAANDHVGHRVIEAARTLGKTPGADFLLVGFDDGVGSNSLGMSTMRPPLEELGQNAARLAVRALADDPTVQRVCLSYHLLKRNSTQGSF